MYATIMMFIESNAVLHDIVVNCCIYGINGNADYACFLVFVLSQAILLVFSATPKGQDVVFIM